MEPQISMESRDNIFHLGLCMAGSVSAGAYIAGVVDYLVEALENWERARKNNDPTVPDHQVVIDLMGGSSGGGITAALSFFALRDKLQHPVLDADGKTYHIDPEKNILWKLWVELNEHQKGNVASQMLDLSDIKPHYVASGLNTDFVNDLTGLVKNYVRDLAKRNEQKAIPTPPYLNPRGELFISLFNLTGIKYKLFSRGAAPAGATHFFSEHRDLAHFRWEEKYGGKGRIPLHFAQLNDSLEIMLDAAKATSAFPVGLRAVTMERPAKYIWDNPFFHQGKFNSDTIELGKKVNNPDDRYRSLHSDSGVANNEPVELSRDLLYMIREEIYREHGETKKTFGQMTDTEQARAKANLNNTAVILIDPFPAHDFKIVPPNHDDDNLVDWSGTAIKAMSSQLLFDAKQALDAYDKNDYGLTIIEPSKEGKKPGHAIACGSLSGFGGFLCKEFRIHDFFLGRRNCQSFLRKYFVVDLNEKKDTAAYRCVQSVIEAYERNPAAIERFSFEETKEGKRWAPIIPEVTLKEKITIEYDAQGQARFRDKDPLPDYDLQPLPADFLHQYLSPLKSRVYRIFCNLLNKGWKVDLYIMFGALLGRGWIAGNFLKEIQEDFVDRGLMKKK